MTPFLAFVLFIRVVGSGVPAEPLPVRFDTLVECKQTAALIDKSTTLTLEMRCAYAAT